MLPVGNLVSSAHGSAELDGALAYVLGMAGFLIGAIGVARVPEWSNGLG